MTNEELQAHIEAIECALENGDLEWKNKFRDGEWQKAMPETGIDLGLDCEYRIKPKPLECWVNVYADNGEREIFDSKDSACMAADVCDEDTFSRIAVHMREVSE